MTWIILSLVSAFVLGFYDLAKKSAVRENAVPPVLLLNVLTAASLYLPVVMLSYWKPEFLIGTILEIQPTSATEQLLFALKSVLVGTSWTLAFFALKHLPLSIAAPIRSTSPLFTIVVAVLVLGERPELLQWLGMVVTLVAFFSFSRVGKKEGIHFSSNRWVACMLLATILGSTSSLYDKLLLQDLQYSPATVQAWFSIHLAWVMLPLATYWYVKERKSKPFQWRFSIPLIAICLLIADMLYFSALHQAGSLVSLVSIVRRTSVIIPFAVGVWFLREQHGTKKLICILLMLLGVALIGWKTLE